MTRWRWCLQILEANLVNTVGGLRSPALVGEARMMHSCSPGGASTAGHCLAITSRHECLTSQLAVSRNAAAAAAAAAAAGAADSGRSSPGSKKGATDAFGRASRGALLHLAAGRWVCHLAVISRNGEQYQQLSMLAH